MVESAHPSWMWLVNAVFCGTMPVHSLAKRENGPLSQIISDCYVDISVFVGARLDPVLAFVTEALHTTLCHAVSHSLIHLHQVIWDCACGVAADSVLYVLILFLMGIIPVGFSSFRHFLNGVIIYANVRCGQDMMNGRGRSWPRSAVTPSDQGSTIIIMDRGTRCPRTHPRASTPHDH